MRLIFIRHGEPDYEHDSLTEKGWREAKLLAARTKDWHVDDFYVSPLGRARDTASFTLKAHGKTAEIMDWLHEFLGKVPDGAGGTRLCWDLMPADWKAQPDIYPTVLKDARRDNLANITITCTDNIKSRIDLWNLLKALPQPTYCTYETPLYWMDFGNTQTTGQVVMGTVPKKIKQPASKLYETVSSLKVITRFVRYSRVKEEDSGPSCSLTEALDRQDLFINSTLAQLGCNILWKMFRNGMIEHHGLYLNLETMKVNPINI